MTNPCNSCELQGFLFMTYRSVTEWTSHTALRRGIQEYPFMSFRTAMRNPEIPAKAGTRKRHYVHSSQQREERTKKRRRCYRALSVVGWRRPRGLRNSLRSDSPRPRSSVGWPLPGPIKAESIATMQRLGHTARGGESMSYRAPGIPVHVLPRCDAVSRSCRPWAAKMSTPGIGQDGADGENTA